MKRAANFVFIQNSSPSDSSKLLIVGSKISLLIDALEMSGLPYPFAWWSIVTFIANFLVQTSASQLKDVNILCAEMHDVSMKSKDQGYMT